MNLGEKSAPIKLRPGELERWILRCVTVPTSSDDEQCVATRPGRHVDEEIHRRHVSPLYVVHEEDQRPLCRDCREERGAGFREAEALLLGRDAGFGQLTFSRVANSGSSVASTAP